MKKSDYPIHFGHRTDGDSWIELQYSPPNTASEPHWHETYEVAYQLSGERTYIYPDGLFTLRAGEVLIIPPRTMHGTLISDGDFQAYRLCSEFSVNARFHDKTVHILRSSEPEAVTEPPPMAARSVLDRLA